MTLTGCLHLNWKLNVTQQQTRIFYYENNEFKIVFHPKICKSTLYIFIYGNNRNRYEVSVQIVDNSGNPVFEEHFEGSLNFGPIVWSFDREELISVDDILCNETATFHLSISTSEKVSKPYVEKETGMTQETEVSPCLHTLSQDYSKLFNNAKNFDVVLQCGELKINAHRIILSARSGVFAAMFENDIADDEIGLVNIDDIDPPILEKFIRYIYSGKVDDLSMETAISLYKAADEYELEQLKRFCVLYMVGNLSYDSVCNVIAIAEDYDDIHLKDCVESFIVQNKEFLLTDKWALFSENLPLLAINVYKRFSRSLLTQRDDSENAPLQGSPFGSDSMRGFRFNFTP